MNDRTYFTLKKLHSLSGVVPTAGFLIFHLFENSKSVAGQAAFNETVGSIRAQPYLYFLEIGLIAPILFHALLGIYIAKKASSNVGSYGFRANWMYWLQRATGYLLFFFIGFHLYNTRFAGVASDQMFQYLAAEYAKPAFFVFYLLGILSAAFHMANGLWGFLFAWGIVTGQKSQDMVWKACMGLGLAVALIGVNALLGFSGRGLDWFQHEKTQIIAAPAGAAVK
jgi:succinate dehydrogenase / fumarate reductase cytochrome b subunit